MITSVSPVASWYAVVFVLYVVFIYWVIIGRVCFYFVLYSDEVWYGQLPATKVGTVLEWVIFVSSFITEYCTRLDITVLPAPCGMTCFMHFINFILLNSLIHCHLRYIECQPSIRPLLHLSQKLVFCLPALIAMSLSRPSLVISPSRTWVNHVWWSVHLGLESTMSDDQSISDLSQPCLMISSSRTWVKHVWWSVHLGLE